jgi:hypothetical protein
MTLALARAVVGLFGLHRGIYYAKQKSWYRLRGFMDDVPYYSVIIFAYISFFLAAVKILVVLYNLIRRLFGKKTVAFFVVCVSIHALSDIVQGFLLLNLAAPGATIANCLLMLAFGGLTLVDQRVRHWYTRKAEELLAAA